MEPRDITCKLFNNNDMSIAYRNSAGVIKPQFLYELILFSRAGMIDHSTTSGSLASNKSDLLRTLSESLNEADKLHHNPETLLLIQSEFSRLSKKVKSEHADIFRGNEALQAALGFTELTLCQKTMLTAEYNRHAFFDKGRFIFNEPEPIIDQQPEAPDTETESNLDDAAVGEEETRPSICAIFLHTMLCCMSNIASHCRRPSTRIHPAQDISNPIFETERERVRAT